MSHATFTHSVVSASLGAHIYNATTQLRKKPTLRFVVAARALPQASHTTMSLLTIPGGKFYNDYFHVKVHD